MVHVLGTSAGKPLFFSPQPEDPPHPTLFHERTYFNGLFVRGIPMPPRTGLMRTIASCFPHSDTQLATSVDMRPLLRMPGMAPLRWTASPVISHHVIVARKPPSSRRLKLEGPRGTAPLIPFFSRIPCTFLKRTYPWQIEQSAAQVSVPPSSSFRIISIALYWAKLVYYP